MKGYFPDESIIIKCIYNQVDIQPNNFVCTFPFWEKMILLEILFIYDWAPIPYLNFRHVKSGGKGHRILGSKFSFMRSPGLHESLQPCSRAARKWRENEEMRRKWRENEEMERD